MRLLISILFAFAMLGCSANTPMIIDQVPTGRVGGEPWTARTAVMTHPIVIGGDPNQVSIEMHDEVLEDCHFFGSDDDRRVLFLAPTTPGVYPLRFDLSDPLHSRVVSFIQDDTQELATDGTVEVVSVSATQITFGVVARMGNNDVNGRFTATACQ
jgi:hypothetical protein